MECPYCKDSKCVAVRLATPERLDRYLIKIGYWECEQCDYVKPVYQKYPTQEQDSLIKSVSCHCCNDKGEIHHALVKKYLMEDYLISDPPVPCKRCHAGIRVKYGWDIATKAECDRIHQLRLREVEFIKKQIKPVAQEEKGAEVIQQIETLSQKMSLATEA